MSNILITGACGQLGSELTTRLRSMHGPEKVIASDIKEPTHTTTDGRFEQVDVMDKKKLGRIIKDYNINQIYHLAAMLSATAEQNSEKAWKLNMNGLLHVLNLAKENAIEKIFWPSSIAVFGPDAPKKKTPQHAALNPTTVYGISKMAGEQWCAYYHQKFGVDVRSVRYPGLIGYKSMPGGGTTDYAVDIHHKAVAHEIFACFLKRDTRLPMMYMEDAIDATLQLMQAPSKDIAIRTSYNLAAISFSPAEIAAEIRSQIPDFEIRYAPDERQNIADSWPDSINDKPAHEQWGWRPKYNLSQMVDDMLQHLSEKKNEKVG